MGTHSAGSKASVSADAASAVTTRLKVVVVDRTGDRRQLVTHIVDQGPDATVVGYGDGPLSAIQVVERLRADAAVVEIQLPIEQGLDTISALREDFPALAIIVCSFQASMDTQRAALARGADGYLVKPFSPADLHALIRSAVGSRSEGVPA